MTNKLRERWWREQFNPGWLGLLINPFYFARRGLRKELTELLPALTGEVLDVGCGRQPYRGLLHARRYVGLDIDSAVTRSLGVADVLYDGRSLPFADDSFDGVLCSQVFEHVFLPMEFLAEIRRVLRPEGKLVLTVPFVWDEHEQPVDFARYSSFGLRAQLEQAGFEVLVARKSMPDARAVVQIAAAWLFKVTRSSSRVLNFVAQLALIAPVNVVGVVAGVLLPRNADFYLDNVILARRRSKRA